MKKKMWLIIGILFCVVVSIGYNIFSDHLPPRTPLKIARLRSRLDIPKETQLADFKEVYAFTGEGEMYVKFKLDDTNIDNIITQCKKKNYKKLTVKNLIIDKLIDIGSLKHQYFIQGNDITLIKEGLYQLEAINMNEMDFCITILDVEKKQLIVYVSFR